VPDSEAHLSLIVKVKNLAGSELGKVKKGLSDIKTGALDQLGIGFAGAAGAAALLTGALVKGVQGAIEEQASLKRLTTVLAANVQGWDGHTEAIEKSIKARENLGFSDDAQRESLIKLIPAFKNVNKALDVQATAMDLARLKGISLEDASDALVKVEGGQYRVLKSLGIVLKDGATQTEALAAVQKVAMGQASQYADTLAGKSEALQAKFDDLTEQVGGKLIPVLDDLATAALKVVDAFDPESPQTFDQRLQGLGDTLGQINPMMLTNWTITGVMTDAQNKAAAAAATEAKAMDTLAEKTAANREPTQGLTTDQKRLRSALSLTGQEALDLVNYMIDLRREEQYLFDLGKPKRKGYQPQIPRPAAGTIAPLHGDGGWVGLNGPELGILGDRGPEYIVPNSQLGKGAPGVTIQGVSERDILDMVERGMYFRLKRAGTGA
jgi:hypothetical protein